jgi:translation initiation factor IF-2
MPQTIEAINREGRQCPYHKVINKIDSGRSGRIKQELTQYGLVSEEGAETPYHEVSGQKRIKIKELLEMILLQSEVLELANLRPGRVAEAKLDKGRGPVATVLIQTAR